MAQEARYDAVIVHNVDSDELEPMSANNDDGIIIPAVFVGAHTGRLIIQAYQYMENFALLINNDSDFNINTHLLLPFTIVVGLCFVTMIIFSIVRCCRERRRQMRHRLPKRVLKKIPIVKFNHSIHLYETCAICLEDYEDGEKLRVLPCGHVYHTKCIDPWLTKNRRVCCICKRKVLIRGEKLPSRNRLHSDNSGSSDDDTTPLLTASESQQSSDHGTFQNETENTNQSNQEIQPNDQWNATGVSEDDGKYLEFHIEL